MKAVVSQRNHFESADDLVENAIYQLPDQFKHPDFRIWMVKYTERVVRSVASAFGTGAQRGIEQAAELMCDPNFYETKRKRRAENTKRMKEDRAKQDWERVERTLTPTAEQIEDQVKWRTSQISYHQSQINDHEKELGRLRTLAPHIRAEMKAIQ